MPQQFLLKNQYGQFLLKSGEWNTPKQHLKSLQMTPHKDEAINTKIEITVKSPDVRVEIVSADIDERRMPIMTDALLAAKQPLPQAEPEEFSLSQSATQNQGATQPV